MAFTGNENHGITLSEASTMTKAYRDSSPAGVTLGHFFGKTAINAILTQEGCVGIRIYYGLDENGVKQLVVVGVTANEDDIYNGQLAERSIKCPPACGGPNSLNS